MDWIEATQALQNAQNIIVVTHQRPDGDAIGSLLGLGNAIRGMGKNITCAVDDGVPEFLQFLPYSDTIVSELQAGAWDLLITTDIADQKRAGLVGEYAFAHSQTVINIDHHPTNPRFGDFHLVHDFATSAAEVVFDWWQHMGLAYGKDVAQPLLTGLVTDTLGFRTSSTTARTLEVANQLMQRGASLTEIMARTMASQTAQEFELWKRILPNAILDGEVVYASVTQADAEAVGLEDTTDAGLVEFLVNINEAMVSAIFKERPDNQVGISLRAKRGYNVAEVAKHFGGGGHIQAAGATVDGTLDEIRQRALPLLHLATQKGKLDIV
jgi:phosphoesterase RecJ-like protein